MKVIKNNHRILALLFLIALLMVSCSSTQQTNGLEESPEIAPASAEVILQGNTFQPPEITITAGTSVTWVNEDSVTHTVTSGTRGEVTGEFDATIAPGEVFSYIFEEAGRFEYFCSIHPGMDGTVIAEE